MTKRVEDEQTERKKMKRDEANGWLVQQKREQQQIHLVDWLEHVCLLTVDMFGNQTKNSAQRKPHNGIVQRKCVLHMDEF